MAKHTAPRAYCTYFDSGYLSRGLSLIASLREHGDHSPVSVLALDDEVKQYFDDARLPGVTAITIGNIETAEPELPPLRASRSRMEYYFTTTPLLMRWVMNQQKQPETVVVYLDADLFFFDDPALVLDALGDGSVGIIEHGYPPRLAKGLAKYGRFNVGWVGIRGDDRGRSVVDWWSRSTLDWCFDRPDSGRYADQGYLDQFPTRFEGVVVLPSRGFNLAPWNTGGTDIRSDDGRVTANGDPVVFFHFHGLRRVRRWYVSSQLVYRSPMGPTLRERIYQPYVDRLAETDATVADQVGRGTVPKRRGNGLRGIVGRARKAVIDSLSIGSGNAIRIRRGR